MSSAKELRGRQVTIGVGKRAAVIQVPQKLPANDGEVLENVELDARIEYALEPYRKVVKLGQEVQKLLREDNASSLLADLRDNDPDQPSLFKIEQEGGGA